MDPHLQAPPPRPAPAAACDVAMGINQITTHRLNCGVWRVADVRAARVSATRSTLRIFHTASMAEASHIARMWANNDFSREAGRLQPLGSMKEIACTV